MKNEEFRYAGAAGNDFPAALAIHTKMAYDVRVRCCLWKPGSLC